ncbi:RING finger and SPRY domain-containing protein 1 [Nilaparvata lugens]|uniref:RING finger and SPRY domain-containing protein 1 n=1 Tax=Nilaparvata lugens TaxID=108931 RepID=UPI00193E67FC|nr:RING finger and SPRY domain-containing protein 1 [Nilaparvata lugens]
MGACLCRGCKRERNNTVPQPANRRLQRRARNSHLVVDENQECYLPAGGGPAWWKNLSSKAVDILVLETLKIIGTLMENEQEPPEVLMKLHNIADQEEGWLQVVQSMVHVIPIDEPLGPAVITLLLDDCPLPNKEAVLKLSRIFNLSHQSAVVRSQRSIRQQRNICIILGVLAEKLSGPSSVAILTPGTLAYLVANLEENSDATVTLFSLVALEKFAQTSENKATIIRALLALENGNPLLRLEKLLESTDLIESQVGFCAQWCLDNLFITEGRQYSYENVDMSNINAMLNISDVSEYLKISPDGLEARCDAHSFESVRCTFQVDSGIWYYETTILSSGVMQIGWATRNSRFLNQEGHGIGDDEFSLAFDGCRQFIWYNASNHAQSKVRWKPGDTLGSLIDLTRPMIYFYLNGEEVASSDLVFEEARSGFFAAASFMSFQQCRFNFGSEPFKYPPPGVDFKNFNDHGTLSPEKRIVLPRHLQLESLRQMSVKEDSCTICFDDRANRALKPCGHKGFCERCSYMLNECPICRAAIECIVEEEPDTPDT